VDVVLLVAARIVERLLPHRPGRPLAALRDGPRPVALVHRGQRSPAGGDGQRASLKNVWPCLNRSGCYEFVM
jgi:hypothetical protein